ncbi:MAG: lipocalin-like domain-containing protein, partial [Pseudomonadota bacterium]
HGPHPDFRIEWWYVTANLKAADGKDYGLQWTLFRSALAPEQASQAAADWTSSQIWFCHAAVTGADFHHASERYARGGIGQAGVTAAPFAAWCDDWQMAGANLNKLRLNAAGPEFSYTLDLSSDAPLVRHGDSGFSVKSSSGQASYYYSQPHYQAHGTLVVDGETLDVTGTAWLDREWASQPLADNQTGWDWFSLNFDSGDKLMAFRLRQTDGDIFKSATWIDAQGAHAQDGKAIQLTPLRTARVAGRKIPITWRLNLPDKALDVTIEALNPKAWMDLSIPYWEGPVRISGSHTGRGYLEMTGYAQNESR